MLSGMTRWGRRTPQRRHSGRACPRRPLSGRAPTQSARREVPSFRQDRRNPEATDGNTRHRRVTYPTVTPVAPPPSRPQSVKRAPPTQSARRAAPSLPRINESNQLHRIRKIAVPASGFLLPCRNDGALRRPLRADAAPHSSCRKPALAVFLSGGRETRSEAHMFLTYPASPASNAPSPLPSPPQLPLKILRG